MTNFRRLDHGMNNYDFKLWRANIFGCSYVSEAYMVLLQRKLDYKQIAEIFKVSGNCILTFKNKLGVEISRLNSIRLPDLSDDCIIEFLKRPENAELDMFELNDYGLNYFKDMVGIAVKLGFRSPSQAFYKMFKSGLTKKFIGEQFGVDACCINYNLRKMGLCITEGVRP